jgi:hypothetical protein
MSHSSIVSGATVRGPFTVINAAKKTQENLVDKHMIVLAVQNGQALCVYTGSDADPAFKRLAGYVEVPSHVNASAGWKISRQFYVDAAQMCIVPVELLEVVGSVSQGFLRTVTSKASSLKNISRTVYTASAEERRTGHAREMKNGIR